MNSETGDVGFVLDGLARVKLRNTERWVMLIKKVACMHVNVFRGFVPCAAEARAIECEAVYWFVCTERMLLYHFL